MPKGMDRGLTEAQAALPVLSVMQPWAWLIVNGHKDIENRDWRTHFRGPVLIHAGKRIDRLADEILRAGCNPCSGDRLELDLPDAWETGGIVGEAEIYDCVTASGSPWFMGQFGFLLRRQAPIPLVPCKGALGFFRPNYGEAPGEPRPKTARSSRERKRMIADTLFSERTSLDSPAARAALAERGGQ